MLHSLLQLALRTQVDIHSDANIDISEQCVSGGVALPSMCAKRALASSAALAASRGRRNTLGTDNMAAMDRISFEHLHMPHERHRGDAASASNRKGNSPLTAK
jgi:hypothetical protein